MILKQITFLSCPSKMQVSGMSETTNHLKNTILKLHKKLQISANPALLVPQNGVIMHKSIYARGYPFSCYSVRNSLTLDTRQKVHKNVVLLTYSNCLSTHLNEWKEEKSQNEHKRKNILLHHTWCWTLKMRGYYNSLNKTSVVSHWRSNRQTAMASVDAVLQL